MQTSVWRVSAGAGEFTDAWHAPARLSASQHTGALPFVTIRSARELSAAEYAATGGSIIYTQIRRRVASKLWNSTSCRKAAASASE